ncbi:MAG: PilZ domain-containing protein [Acidobacteria bacterium]|nr:PilZ domain-containing protein [Acidobacteriota bacterium]
MEQNLKVLAVVQSEAVPENLREVFSRKSITLHHARSGAAALVLAGNSLYDLLVLEEPLADLPVDSVLSALQSFEWASAGAPALVMAGDQDVVEIARRLEDHPARVLPKSAQKQEIQQAISELLGVAVRSGSRMMVNVEVKIDSNTSLKCFQSENISESGMLLRGAKAIPIGMAVDLEFYLPDEPDPVRGKAMVVRHSGDSETPGIGLRFVALGRSEILRLRRFVDRILTDKPPSETDRGTGTSQTAGV